MMSRARIAGGSIARERSLCAGLRIIDSPGHTAGHRSLLVQPASGPPVILAGDAADLQENLDREIVPGIIWRDGSGRYREDLALTSIRQLKTVAAAEGAELWPNHDFAHWRRLLHRGWPVLAATATSLSAPSSMSMSNSSAAIPPTGEPSPRRS